ncbi:MAG: DNA-3-methyladenine glycosylase 2 family protein [Thaumarchaeota archaeon]|nr:DNA-3-methyladenine glycosylase 2 family protein [Nitrososphaerota archaeon]
MSRPSLGDSKEFRKGFDHIKKNDPKLGRVLEKHGLIKFKPQGELFESLVESILSQQLASASADSIIRKVRALYPEGKLEAVAMSKTPSRKLRSSGVSPQKLTYLKDLSTRVAKGKIDLESLREKDDEEILTVLDEVRGIGPWTVQMLLIFTLGRTDVMPVDDLVVRKAIQRLYSLEEMPKKADVERLSENWKPYRTVASLYLWRHKDTG